MRGADSATGDPLPHPAGQAESSPTCIHTPGARWTRWPEPAGCCPGCRGGAPRCLPAPAPPGCVGTGRRACRWRSPLDSQARHRHAAHQAARPGKGGAARCGPGRLLGEQRWASACTRHPQPIKREAGKAMPGSVCAISTPHSNHGHRVRHACSRAARRIAFPACCRFPSSPLVPDRRRPAGACPPQGGPRLSTRTFPVTAAHSLHACIRQHRRSKRMHVHARAWRCVTRRCRHA